MSCMMTRAFLRRPFTKLTPTTAKHFINDPTHLVKSALKAVTQTNPTTALDEENKVVYLRLDAVKPQVSLVSGGGAGHEPSFAAFVGPGLLSGAVAGTIFASPSAEQVRRCILQRVEKSKGVLVVVMNYTGDVLNFGMAVEKAKAAGIEADHKRKGCHTAASPAAVPCRSPWDMASAVSAQVEA